MAENDIWYSYKGGKNTVLEPQRRKEHCALRLQTYHAIRRQTSSSRKICQLSFCVSGRPFANVRVQMHGSVNDLAEHMGHRHVEIAPCGSLLNNGLSVTKHKGNAAWEFVFCFFSSGRLAHVACRQAGHAELSLHTPTTTENLSSHISWLHLRTVGQEIVKC